MRRLFHVYILLSLLILPGCAGNIKNISADISSTDSVIVGYIETVPALWEFSLYEERSKAEDKIDIAGKGFGVSRASKLQNQGYLFKIARPGIYILRLQKRIGDNDAHDHIVRFEVPEGRLVYFGTIRVVIDRVEGPLHGDRMSRRTPIAFQYHYVHIDEDDTLKHFEEQYPQAYSSYKDKIIRIPSPSRPRLVTLLQSDDRLYNQSAPWF